MTTKVSIPYLNEDGDVPETMIPDLSRRYVGPWDPVRSYSAGQAVVSPSGELVVAKADVSAGTQFNADDWSGSTSASVSALKDALELDIAKVRPTFVTELELVSTTVMQFCAKEPVSGNYFVTQANSGTTSTRETTRLSRCAPDGTLLDSMTLQDAGHGTTIAVERIGTKTYIWISWQEALAGGSGNDLVRFEYRPNVTLTRSQTTYFTVFPKFVSGSTYINVAFDWANDWVAVRQSTTGSESFVRRKISELKAGIDKTYGNIGPLANGAQADGSQITMQGYATLGDTMYWYQGNSDLTSKEPRQIRQYDWDTGALVTNVSTESLGKNADGTTFGNFQEPEGISLYRDPYSGQASLIAGVTTGASGARVYWIYIFSSLGADKFLDVQVRKLERTQYAQPRGKARRLNDAPDGVTKLEQLVIPGWWYLTAADFMTMTDRPADSVNAGHFVEVGGSATDESRIQRLMRNSSVSADQWTRVVNPGTSSTKWNRVTQTAVDFA